MISRDDLGGGHHGGGDIGDIALQSDQGLCPGQAGLVENTATGVGLDEAGGLGGTLTADDRPGAGLLGIEGLLIAPRSFCRVRPDGPPGPRMLVGVPGRFGRRPVPMEASTRVARARRVVRNAEAAERAAAAAGEAALDTTQLPKVVANTTDPQSRIMP